MNRNNKKIICNQCGKEIGRDGECHSDFLEITKNWGYFSNGKDGCTHRIFLCEDCYDKWILGFSIPPLQEEYTEYM